MLDIERLKSIIEKFEDLTQQLANPDVITDTEKLTKIARERAEMEDLYEAVKKYLSLYDELKSAKEMLENESDDEMKEFLKEEIDSLEEKLSSQEEEVKFHLIGKDPNDEKNVIMEIRAGAGGEEASLFAAELFRMYSRYAERNGWKVEILSTSFSDMGGYKEVIFMVKGRGAYSRLKYESGVHRVQRVPVTESSGRIHTSTATVAVLPEVQDVEVHIDPKDLKIDTYRSSGPGGQHVNVTDSAVRITHIPTGIVVACQEERSQLQNRERAMQILRAKLYELEKRRQEEEIAKQRRQQVGTGERSEKIRTYNFPQGRVTDHRIGKTIYNLEAFLDGEIDEMVDDLVAWDRAEKLKSAM
ncbi:MAG: peptide chain release factor 1 [Actinobacteria bacterium]|nr:peptide chain release factor 1 [Actinomycetota bacterium]